MKNLISLELNDKLLNICKLLDIDKNEVDPIIKHSLIILNNEISFNEHEGILLLLSGHSLEEVFQNIKTNISKRNLDIKINYDKDFYPSKYFAICDWKSELCDIEYHLKDLLGTHNLPTELLESIEFDTPNAEVNRWLMQFNTKLQEYNYSVVYLYAPWDSYCFGLVKNENLSNLIEQFNNLFKSSNISCSKCDIIKQQKSKIIEEDIIISEKDIDKEIEIFIEEETKIYDDYGFEVNSLSVDGTCKYIYYGRYPQKIVDDQNIINELDKLTSKNDNGYYELLGNEYEKICSLKNEISKKYPKTSMHNFSNGKEMIENEIYYFKVEPIRWRVLVSKSKELKVISTSILDGCIFSEDNTNCNYENSYCRYFLNNTFLNKAFTLEERDFIKTSLVDNSDETLENPKKQLSSEITEDKIYALSYKEGYMKKYSFTGSKFSKCNARFSLLSDYAFAKGCKKKLNETGYWLSRSPFSYGQAIMITEPKNLEGTGIRPVFNFDLAKIKVKK